ncbi:MAG: hypothetical protein PHO61_04425 [Candidatus ainarchaeum sp.]|nr:hypothetical protein [Candidatus ainarchaeum sp.]
MVFMRTPLSKRVALKKGFLRELTPNEFVMKYFGYKPLSVKVTHNPDSIRGKFISQWGIQPERALSWGNFRGENSANSRKALIFVNKNLQEYIKARGNKRRGFEVKFSLVYELAKAYSEREGKVSQVMQEPFANMIALEYFAKTNPLKLKLIMRAALNKNTENRFLIQEKIVKLFTYLTREQREKIIKDTLEGRITSSGKEFDLQLLNLVSKQKNPPLDYINYLKKSISAS